MAAGGAWFERPAAIEHSIDSSRSAEDLAALVRDAAARGRRSPRVDGSAYIVALGGTVRGAAVDLEARLLRTDGARGRPKLPLRVTGTVRDRPAGSTLGGRPAGSILEVLIAPDDRLTARWVLGVPAITAVGMLVAGFSPVAILLIGGLAVPNVLVAIRTAQRFALRSVSQVEALLEAIAGGR